MKRILLPLAMIPLVFGLFSSSACAAKRPGVLHTAFMKKLGHNEKATLYKKFRFKHDQSVQRIEKTKQNLLERRVSMYQLGDDKYLIRFKGDSSQPLSLGSISSTPGAGETISEVHLGLLSRKSKDQPKVFERGTMKVDDEGQALQAKLEQLFPKPNSRAAMPADLTLPIR